MEIFLLFKVQQEVVATKYMLQVKSLESGSHSVKAAVANIHQNKCKL